MKDVKEGTISLEEFVSAMTVEELSNLLVGQPGTVVQGAAGETYQNAEKGITPMVFTDGPAGIRVTPEYEDENLSLIHICVSLKHYAANQMEGENNDRWNKLDSIMSERTLREIYLKNFEIVIKNARCV